MGVAISGSGRCGSSMVAGLLAHSGLYLGDWNGGLTYADGRNEKGYWEAGFLLMTRRLLDHIRVRYGGAEELAPDGWENDPGLEPFYEEARATMATEFAGHEPWGWKFTQWPGVLPFFHRLVPDLKFVLVVRNPRDVVSSFLGYGGFQRREAERIWLSANIRLLLSTTPEQRILTFYEDYFPDYRKGLLPVLDFVGLPRPAPGSVADRALDDFRTARLQHHASAVDDVLSDPGLFPLTKELYVQMLGPGREGANIPILHTGKLILDLVADLRASDNRRQELEQILASRTHRTATAVCNLLIRLRGRRAERTGVGYAAQDARTAAPAPAKRHAA